MSRNASDFVAGDPMGMHLSRALGSDYFAVGSMTGTGTFLQWEARLGTARGKPVVKQVPEPPADSYEANFRLGPATTMIVPLRGTVPPWLAGPAAYFSAGTGGPTAFVNTSLPEKFDAVIYIETTSATTPLRPTTP